MTRRARLLTALALTAIAAASARAQVVGTLGAGTGHVTYDDTPRLTIVSVTPSLSFEGERTTVSAVASFTRFDGGIWSTQGVLAGSRFTEAYGLFRGEFSGQAETNSHRRTVRSSQILGQGRAHLAGDTRGVWLGAGAGHTWREPQGGMVWRADAGAWAQVFGATLRVTAAHNVVETAEDTENIAPRNTAQLNAAREATITRSIARYLDADVHMSWMSSRLSLEGAVGQRRAYRDRSINTWLLGGSFMLTERVALVGAAGSSAFDFAQGLPGGRYASVALRVTTRSGGGFDMTARRRAVAEGLQTWREQDGQVLLVVHAPHAQRVELMGDFTDWRPLMLTRAADGSFAARVDLPAGSYRVNVRVDGGLWTAPPGTTPVADDYNGAAGLLVIGA